MVVPRLSFHGIGHTEWMYEYKVQVNQNGPTGITAILGSRSSSGRLRCAGHRCQGRPSPSVYDGITSVLLSELDAMKNPTRVLGQAQETVDLLQPAQTHRW